MPTKYLYVTQWHTFIEIRLKSVHVDGKVSQNQNTLNGVLSSGKQFEDIAVRKANRSEFLVLLLIVDSSFVLSSLGRLSKDLCTH